MHFPADRGQMLQIARDARHSAMRDILDKITVVAVSLGFVAGAASVYRVTRFGWNLNIACDLAVYVIIISLLLLRRKLPLAFVVPCFVAAMGMNAVANYLTMGLVAIGPIIIATGCIAAGIFYGQARSFILLFASLSMLAAIAAADVVGLLPRHQNLAEYVHSTEAWLSHLASGGMFIIAILVSVGSVQHHLVEAMSQLKAKTDQLEKRESDRKAAQEENAALSEQLRQSEKLRAIGQLAGGIAHDFNNQLSGIFAYADLIQAQYSHEPRLKGYAEGILMAARRANDLTDKLLDYARKEPARSITFDLDAVVAEVVGILQHSLGKNIAIETSLDASAGTLQGDPTQIQSALLNLALNARDAMPSGGTIEIRTKSTDASTPGPAAPLGNEKTPSRIQLTVSDTGSGIDEEHLPRIFEPFFTTKTAGQGTGMGLATVHSAVEAHGGTISVQSKIGRGTCFSICLPAAAPLTKAIERPTLPEISSSCDGHVLLVDDEAIVRKTTGLMLEQLGYRVTTASNADEALRSFQPDAFSLVLLDLVLPGRNGLEIYTALEQIDPHVRVVLMSGYSAGLDAGELIEKRRLPFLAKPFSFAELKSRLTEAMAAGA